MAKDGFKYFLFSPVFGEDSNFDLYFPKGLKPPTRESLDIMVKNGKFERNHWILGIPFLP